MTINNLHQRISSTAKKSKDSTDEGKQGLIPLFHNTVVPAKDFEGVLIPDGKFLEDYTYKQLDAMKTIIINYKAVVK